MSWRFSCKFAVWCVALVRVALVAGGDEVLNGIQTAPTVRLDVIDHRAEVVQERGVAPGPVSIVVCDSFWQAGGADEELQILHGRTKPEARTSGISSRRDGTRAPECPLRRWNDCESFLMSGSSRPVSGK
jgi:hypothetical protein